MTDLELVARQLRRETEAAEEARHNLQKRRAAANERSYASSNIESRKAIAANLEAVAERIQGRMAMLSSGRAALDAETVVSHLKSADPQTLALIAMKTALDVLGKDPFPLLQDLTTGIGANVQLELRMTYYAQENPELYKKVEKHFHSSTGTAQKATVFKLRFNREGIEWDRWSNTVNHKVGNFLLNCLNDATGWLETTLRRNGKKTSNVITYTRKFIEHRDTVLAACERLAFSQWPMLCPPVDWTTDSLGGYMLESSRNPHSGRWLYGGYLTEQIRQANPLIRKTGKVGPLKQGDIPIAMLNNLQQQAYKVNPVVFAVADHLYEQRISVGKFRHDAPLDPPPSPGEDATEEQLAEYKRTRREREDYNAQLSQKNWRTTEVMYAARKYAPEERFWMPASFDYRGRVYFLNTALNPQGTDFDKSLLYFADEGEPNEWWIGFHLSTTYGNDKATLADRIQWVKDNQALITRVAEDPIGNHEWHEADEPWSFLAACLEYHAIFIAKTKTTSGLPIGIDATCSGLQHLAAMTKCGRTAALVNVTPTPKPADAYLTVANAACAYLPSEQVKWMSRKVTKRSVMTTPYGVTMQSARGYIREQLLKDGHKEELKQPGVLTGIVKAIFNKAIPEVLPGPIKVMAWLKRSAGEILKGADVIQWRAPSGFIVTQDLRASNTVEVKTRLLGGARIKVLVGDGWADGPDVTHHKSALAPNVVHSYDAALLHLTFAFWDRPFTVIHDCILGRSCDMKDMSAEIRLHFAEMYKGDVLEDWAKQVGVEIPPDLIQDTLDIDSVNRSEYFFS